MSNNNLFSGSKSEHSLSGYSSKMTTDPAGSEVLMTSITDRKAASRAKMGSRDRGLAGRTGQSYLQSNTSLTNLSESLQGSTVMTSWPDSRSTTELDQLGVVMSPSGLVPAYRPAPDYETAVMSKYGGPGGPPGPGGGGGLNPQLAQLYSSQPSLQPGVGGGLQHNQNNNLDLTFPTAGPGPVYLSSSLVPPAGYPLTTSHTYSTPELNTFLDHQQQHRGNTQSRLVST